MTTARDGKKYRTRYFNLDVIISVGYRVKSKRGTQFRIWADAECSEPLACGELLTVIDNCLQFATCHHPPTVTEH